MNRRDILLASIRRAEEELAKLDTLDLSKLKDGTVIRFDKCFASGGRRYTYTAIKVDGRWFTSGSGIARATNDAMTAWILDGRIKDVKVQKATKWETILP